MTMIHTASSTISLPLNGTFSRISDAFNRYFAAKSGKAAFAAHIKQLSAMDSHMLNDIGLKNFKRLPMAQQQDALREAVKQAQKA